MVDAVDNAVRFITAGLRVAHATHWLNVDACCTARSSAARTPSIMRVPIASYDLAPGKHFVMCDEAYDYNNQCPAGFTENTRFVVRSINEENTLATCSIISSEGSVGSEIKVPTYSPGRPTGRSVLPCGPDNEHKEVKIREKMTLAEVDNGW